MAKGLSSLRAAFQDARDSLERDKALDDPDPHEMRLGHEPGAWPGHPYNALPPGCKVIPLGQSEGEFHFVDTLGQVRNVKKIDNDVLFSLFQLTPNFVHWAWPRFAAPKKGRPKTINGLESNDAKQCLIKAAAERGIFDPVNGLRGRGAWLDDSGRVIWHAGDTLWRIDGGALKKAPPGQIGDHFYPALKKTFHPWREPVSTADSPAREIFAMLRTWRWERPEIDPVFAIGELACGLLSGALPQRPHAFVTGDRGVGKTYLQELFRAVWGAAGIALEDATEAGIAQLSRLDALPISFDELEARADNKRAETIINLARIAYSGAARLRGTADHDAKLFRIRSCFFFSAINPPPMGSQDRSRMVMLSLRRIPHDAETPDILENRDDMVGRKLLRQLMDSWPELLKRMTRWADILREAQLSKRMQDTYGALLAAAETLIGEEAMGSAGLPVTEAHLGARIAELTEAERAEQTDNWAGCLNHLLQSTIEHWKGGEKPTIGGAWEHYLHSQEGDAGTVLRNQLAAAGLGLTAAGKTVGGKLRPMALLAVPMSAKGRIALAKMFEGTEWNNSGWAGALKQAPEHVVIRAQGNEANVKINGVTTRCFLVDLAAFEKEMSDG